MDAAPSPAELAAVAEQLGRTPRGVHGVAHRCPCGWPDVVATLPRLPDGTPFPTTFYLTCPRLASSIGRLEESGLMRQMSDRLAADPDLASRYRNAHADYMDRRDRLGRAAGIDPVAEIGQVTAGGMPDRVKCLHALVGHALAAGPGVNPLGDEALELLAPWWTTGPCVATRPGVTAAPAGELSTVAGRQVENMPRTADQIVAGAPVAPARAGDPGRQDAGAATPPLARRGHDVRCPGEGLLG